MSGERKIHNSGKELNDIVKRAISISFYDKLFEGTQSEWNVAFGNDKHRKNRLRMYDNVFTIRDKVQVDIRQYNGMKILLKSLDFIPMQKETIQDTTGMAIYVKKIMAPPNGHLHTLTVKVFNSTHFKDTQNEFIKTSSELRGYFSISHAMNGMGLWIGDKLMRPKDLLNSPAPILMIVPISCKSYEFFLGDIQKYLDENKIPKEKLAFFGTTQDIEIMQSTGAFAVLKQIFVSILTGESMLTLFRNCNGVYTPIMPSYDPINYKRNSHLLVMDKYVQMIPILKGWIGGEVIELQKISHKEQ